MAAAVLSLLLLLLLFPLTFSDPPSSDVVALLLLKDSFTNADSGPLSSWSTNSSSSPCNSSAPWPGVICFHGIVTGLRLGNLNLSGTINIDALSHFKALRSVSFINNHFSGPIPSFSRLDALKSIYVSNNNFSGEIPSGFFINMDHLKKLWLDGNSFSGQIPSSLSKATSLIELRLENNRFTGEIPDLNLSSLKSFNVSSNDLTGAIPAGLAKFGASTFEGNSGLCGPQIGAPCGEPPAKLEASAAAKAEPPPENEADSGKVVVIGIVLLLLFFALIAGVAVIRSRRREADFDTLGVEAAVEEMEVAAAEAPVESSHKRSGSSHKRSGSSRAGSRSTAVSGGGGTAELVMVNEEKGVFGLPDLMKAAAEVLGNGGLGSAYKAVMANGVAVAVKRIREMNRVGKEVFDAEMRRLGRLRHKNVLTPLAYHYRKEEKLVVSEFVNKGSLLFILHGDRGPDHAALDWPTRLKIVQGIARGMAYLHAELNSLDVPHGDLKSGNVLLGPDLEPLIVDYGFIGLVNPSQASHVLFAYKSPEAIQYRHVSHKSDVYCLGIVILEILTGKFPSQYLNNTKGGTDIVQWTASAISENREADLLDPDIAGAKNSVADMVRLLRVGAACAEPNPDQRPDMKEVAALVEEIAAGDGGGSGDETPAGEEEALGSAPLSRDGYAELSGSSRMRRTESMGQGSSRRNG